MTQGETRTVDVPTAAKILGIGRGTAYALIAEGRLPALRLGRRLVVPKAALEKLLAEGNDVGLSEGEKGATAD